MPLVLMPVVNVAVMAQGLGHPDEHLFWVWAIPSYIVGAYMLLQIVRLLREEIWYRRLIRSHSI